MQHQLRMKEAARRLATCEPITAICYDLGYTNPSHFSRRFKRSFGCSPVSSVSGRCAADFSIYIQA
ncbi:helix-turn-helix domain-containing protein [Aliamphritea spongicola]|nr:helix-turn-helix domain-containing protein [Aliamphritea spongicola]